MVNPKGKRRKKAYAVFEGGGVRGIGIAGALEVAEKYYHWEKVAGTSAGSIIAALVAAGYTAGEIKKLVLEMNLKKWKDRFPPSEVPLAGPIYSFLSRYGIYRGKYIEDWMEEHLAAKNVHCFGDLARIGGEPFPYRLQVVTSDISRGRMVVLPRDLKQYGLDPDQFPVARAVRMSCAIPFFFAPVQVEYKDKSGVKKISYFVDGGVLSNYPLWLFEEKKLVPRCPTIGFRLVGPNEDKPRHIKGPVSFMGALISTMMEAHDARYLEESHAKTISIPTLGIGATDFDLSEAQKLELYNSGKLAAKAFFNQWGIRYYLQKLFKLQK